MGNSSSIVKECIFFNAKGILIGQRQNGRLIGNNVKRVEAKKSAILAELNVVKHQEIEIKIEHNPYYVGNGVEVLVNHLRSSIKKPQNIYKGIREMKCATTDATILECLGKLDENKGVGVPIIDKEGRMQAYLTDGDIRRALIKGADLSVNCMKAANKNFIMSTI